MFFVPLLLLSTKPGLDPWALISRVPTYYYIVNVLGPKTGGVVAGEPLFMPTLNRPTITSKRRTPAAVVHPSVGCLDQGQTDPNALDH